MQRMHRAPPISMESPQRRRRREQVVDRGARAARLDEDVRGGGGLGGTQGEGGGDAVGVAVGFDEVATFDVRLEVEVGDEGLEGFGF